MDKAAHSSDKVAIATILAPRVIDPERAFTLNDHLTHSSDKQAIQALFK